MDHPVIFARHFARLVWLLLHEPAGIEEQKAALRALVAAAREGAVTLVPSAAGISANRQPVAAATSGVAEVAARLGAHAAGAIVVHAEATASDLLDTARLIAADPRAGTDAAERLRAAGVRTVHLSPVDPAPGPAVALDGFELVSDDVMPPVDKPARREWVDAAALTESAPDAVTGLFSQFASVSADRREHLLAELADAPHEAMLAVLDRAALAAEQAQRDGDAAALTAIVAAVLRREALADDASRRDYAMAFRRMISAHGLRMVAAQLPRRSVPKQEIELVLSRAGEAGADAVIDQLIQAQDAGDRRAYFEMLLSLRAGIPALVHMLGDSRWYVVRNAVELLGEMQVTTAERQITALCTHADDRVRTAATSALLRFDTPGARATVQAALRSDVPATRLQAVTALGMRRASHAADTLGRVLERERDEGVLRAIYAALGKVATPDAVERLAEAAAPATGLFRRKPPALRVAAVAALGEARTPAALAALQALQDDRDREVREAVQRALAAARGRQPSVTGVFERAVRGE